MKIGIALPLAETDDGRQSSYAEIRALAQQADASGYDSIWVFDHLLFRYPEKPTRGIWEAWTVLAGLAEATSKVELGTLVLCVPFRNPALLAKMAETLDEMSGGRLILGIGAGWHEPEFDAFGFPFDHLASRFQDAVEIIHPLLTTGAVDVGGDWSQARNAVLRPRGPRPAGLPLLIAGSKPRMLRLTARYADAWNTCWLGLPTLLGERRAALDAACAEVGRDPAAIATTVGIAVAYPDLDPTITDIDNPDLVLTGSPREIAAGLAAHAAAGVAHVMVLLSPNTPEALARLTEAVRLFRA